nr:MAG TPA_asm: hypothetical protein [Caudoviricetes sp.]
MERGSLIKISHRFSHRHAGNRVLFLCRLSGTADDKERDITGHDRDNK